MARLIELPTFKDHRGSLTVIEKSIPFEILRVYYIYGVANTSVARGRHSHKKTSQALICVHGSVKIACKEGERRVVFSLDRPDCCLILEPQDWHEMYEFSSDAVLLVLASEYFDADDYIDDPA